MHIDDTRGRTSKRNKTMADAPKLDAQEPDAQELYAQKLDVSVRSRRL